MTATLENAIQLLRLKNTPVWWLTNGQLKMAEYTESDNVEDAVLHLQQAVGMLPPGNYKLKYSDKASNHSGAFHYSFSTVQGNQTANLMQPQQPSTNAYGIADHVLKQIQEEAKRTFMFEQMYNDFPNIKKRLDELGANIEKIEKYLKEDLDGDGTPDIMQSAKKLGEVAETVGSVKKIFSGSSLFGNPE